MGTSRLGSLLVEEGLLSEADRRTIKGTCGSHGPAFARSIIALGLLEEDELAAFLAEKTPWRVASKDLFSSSEQAAWGSVDRPLLERLEVLPLRLVNHTLYVAMVDPLDQDTIKQLAFFTGYKIHPVISTLTQIRISLGKLLKNYRPASSHLEELISNHAVAAGRRVRLSDLTASPPLAAPPVVPVEEEALEEIEEFEIETAPEPAPKPVGKPAAKAPLKAVAPLDEEVSVDLEYPDSVNAAEEEFDDPAPPAHAPIVEAISADRIAPAAADSGNSLMAEDPFDEGLDDIEGLDSELEADLAGGAETDLLTSLGAEEDALAAKPAKPKPSMAEVDELESLADLSEFDPDKDSGAALSFDDELAPDATTAAAPVEPLLGAEPATPNADDLFGDLESLADAGDAGGESNELDADLTGDLVAEDAVDEALGLNGGGEPVALEMTDDQMAGLLGEATPEPRAETESDNPLGDDFGLDEPAAPLDDEPLGAEPGAGEGDPLAEAGTGSVAESTAANLNRALLAITMAKDALDGLTRAAAALEGAGLSRGLLLVIDKGQARPLGLWEKSGDTVAVKRDGLASFITPGLAPALSRLFAGWTAFDDATRDANLKPFVRWLTAEHGLRAATLPAAGGKQLVAVCAWHSSTRDDAHVKSTALELFRRLAPKI